MENPEALPHSTNRQATDATGGMSLMPSRSRLNHNVLIIDADDANCEAVKNCLDAEGFPVDIVSDGQEALTRAATGNYAIAVLDILLPGFNGLELLRRLRADSRIPVIVATSRAGEIDRIVGLEVGAEDYLLKPVNPREMLARVRAVLRRVRSPRVAEEFTTGKVSAADVELDGTTRTARVNERPLELTTTEYALLDLFLRRAGRVIPREVLVESALGRAFSPLDRSIDLHVSHLRQKLGRYPDGTPRIKAVRGVGYVYACPARKLED